MKQESFTPTIFSRFFAPAVVAAVCLGLANVADALFVGVLQGETALAAISLVTPIYMVFNFIDVGFAVGGSILFSQHVGEGKVEDAKAVFRQVFWATFIAGCIVAALGVIFIEPILRLLGTDPSHGAVYQMTKDYALPLIIASPSFFLNVLLYNFLRCDDGEKRAMAAFVTANLLDVGLSFVFVMVFRMGIKGAVWATIIGTTMGVVISLPHLFKKDSMLSPKPIKPDLRIIFGTFKTGFASSLRYVGQFVLFLTVNNLLMRTHGETGVAIFDLCLNISYLAAGLSDGVANTTRPLSATFHGERNEQAKRETLSLSFKWGGALCAVLLAGIAIWAEPVAAVFGISQGMLPTAGIALRLYCLGGVGTFINTILGTYWQSTGGEKQSVLLTLLRSFAFYLLFAIPLSLMPLTNFGWLFPLTEFASLLVMVLWQLAIRAMKARKPDEGKQTPVFQRLLTSSREEIGALLSDCEAFCTDCDASAGQTCFVTMAAEEVCGIIFTQAEKMKADRDVYIQVTLFRSADDAFDLHIRDNAPPFDPFLLRSERLTSLEADQELVDNLGVLLIKKKSKEFHYHHYQGFNTLMVRI